MVEIRQADKSTYQWTEEKRKTQE